MILHRFMSKQEYNALIAGDDLHSCKIHKLTGQHTDSVGFCFFPEEPDEAIHWLSWIVNADVCVTMDIPDDLLTKSRGRYRDVEKDKGLGLFDPIPMIWRTEYCLTDYSLRTVRVLDATFKYQMYGRLPEVSIVDNDPEHPGDVYVSIVI